MSDIMLERSSKVKGNVFDSASFFKYSPRTGDPRPPVEAISMTIAAGFRCQNSMVFCADQEITRGTGKSYETKIWTADCDKWSVLVTGAGTWGYLRSTANKICGRAKKLASVAKAQKEIEAIVNHTYTVEMANDPYRGTDYAPHFDLIVAISYSKSIAVFRSELNSLRQADDPEVVGTGEPIARYLFKQYYTPTISADDGITLGVHILSAVKQSGFGCGGPTDLYVLERGKPPEPLAIGHIEEMLRGLRIPFRDLLFATPKVHMLDAEFRVELERIMRLLQSSRESNKKYRRLLAAIASDIFYRQ